MREKMKKIQVMLGEMWSNNKPTNQKDNTISIMMMMEEDKVNSTNKSNNHAGKGEWILRKKNK